MVSADGLAPWLAACWHIAGIWSSVSIAFQFVRTAAASFAAGDFRSSRYSSLVRFVLLALSCVSACVLIPCAALISCCAKVFWGV